MKNVLLLVHDDAGQEGRLQGALDLVRALDGHLSCLDVSVLPILAGASLTGAAGAMVIEAEQERRAANEQRLQARLAHEDVAWNWVSTSAFMVDAVLDAAKLADLVVLNSQLDAWTAPEMRGIARKVVTHAGRPVAAMPQDATAFRLDRALVAWDGSAAAAAALRDAVPVLALAKNVEIVTVRTGREEGNPEDAAEYLSRHGIHADVRIIENRSESPDRLLRAECQRWSADYLVMGAYGHGMLRETFGGLTRRMLAESQVPLILGH